MTKYMNIRVTIAPINSSEQARTVFSQNMLPVEDIPENTKEVIRWVDKFEAAGLNFNTSEFNGNPSDLCYDLGYKAVITYNSEMNTGIVDYTECGGWRNPILLRRENYVKTVEYKEVYPSLEDLKDRPLDEVVAYIKYLYNKIPEEAIKENVGN